MIRVYQTKHGAEGDCWPAVLASWFEVPLEQVEQCACHNLGWEYQTAKFIKSQGCHLVQISARLLEQHGLSESSAGCHCLLIGKTVAGVNHVVIAEINDAGGFDILHDPCKDGLGIKNQEVRAVGFICNLSC